MSQASAIALHPNTVINFFPLTSQPMGESKIFLGSPLTSHYIIVGEEWETLTKLSYAPITPERIFNALRKASPSFFDFRYWIVSIQVMLLHMIEHNLIEKVGNQTIHIAQKKGINSLEIPKWPKYFITKIHLVLYLLLASLAFIFPLINHDLIPVPNDFFWYRFISFSFLTYFSLNWISGVIHELAHYIVSGSQGVKSKMEISHRLNFVVLQTRFPNIFSITKNWRIITFLAG